MAARQLVDYIENGNIVNSVNYPALTLPREGKSRICILHKNVANMIAQFTSAVSAKGINIANMSDKSKGDYAYCVIDIDGDAASDIIAAIAAIDGVLKVRAI
jgi:D-3-phosphoglycerate dehydrogenase